MTIAPRGSSATTSQAVLATSFMVLAGAMFAFMHGTVRLMSFELHPFLIAFFGIYSDF